MNSTGELAAASVPRPSRLALLAPAAALALLLLLSSDDLSLPLRLPAAAAAHRSLLLSAAPLPLPLLRAPSSFGEEARWRPDAAAFTAPERCAPKDLERDWLPQLIVNVRQMREDDAAAARLPALFSGRGEEALARQDTAAVPSVKDVGVSVAEGAKDETATVTRGGGGATSRGGSDADRAASVASSGGTVAGSSDSSSAAPPTASDFGACGSGLFSLSPEVVPSAYGNLRDCLALARSVPPARFCERTIFHAYWAFAPARAQAAWMLASFVATQDPQFSELWLWAPLREAAAVRADPLLAPFFTALGSRVRFVEFNATAEAAGSPLEGRADLLQSIGRDERVWLEGDLFRALVLFRHGGVYLDADVLLLRNLGPLLGEEWAYPWGTDCLESNNAVMRVFARSTWATALLEYIGRTPPTAHASYVWGKEALRATSYAFQRLPPCFVNPLWMSNMVGEAAGLDGAPSFARSRGAFATHLHGSVFKLGERADPASEYVAFKRAIWARILTREPRDVLRALRPALVGGLDPPL